MASGAVEAVFTYTSDGTLVVRHDFEKDGSYYRLEIKPSGSLVMDTKTFTSTPAVYEQTPMTAVDLLYLMQEYPDMYLITDTKTTDKAQVQRQFRDLVNIANNIGSPEILSRIIPQLYNKEMLSWIKEIYPFENWFSPCIFMQIPIMAISRISVPQMALIPSPCYRPCKEGKYLQAEGKGAQGLALPSIATASLRMLLPQAWTAFIPTASNPMSFPGLGLRIVSGPQSKPLP